MHREERMAERFALGSAQANPSACEATIQFSLGAPGAARLWVYDVLGREVAVVVDGALAEGVHEACFDGSSLPSGCTCTV